MVTFDYPHGVWHHFYDYIWLSIWCVWNHSYDYIWLSIWCVWNHSYDYIWLSIWCVWNHSYDYIWLSIWCVASLLWLHLVIYMVCNTIAMVMFGYPYVWRHCYGCIWLSTRCVTPLLWLHLVIHTVCRTIAVITFGYEHSVWYHWYGYIWLSTWCAAPLLWLHLVIHMVCCTIAMVTFGYPHDVCRRFCGAAEVRADSQEGHALEPGLRPHRLPGPLHQSGCGHGWCGADLDLRRCRRHVPVHRPHWPGECSFNFNTVMFNHVVTPIFLLCLYMYVSPPLAWWGQL